MSQRGAWEIDQVIKMLAVQPQRLELDPSIQNKSQAWWHEFVIPVLGRENQTSRLAISQLQVAVKGPVEKNKRTGKIAQQIKCLPHKPGDPTLMPRTYDGK